MNFRTRNRRRSSPVGNLLIQVSPPRLTLTLMCVFALVSAAQATTLLDPSPEPSTTQFGRTIVSLGDINGDGVPDFAVGAPFQDGDFVSTDTGFGKPQNVGKVFVIDGASLAVLSMMIDPEFEMIQDQHFGGQLGASLGVSADIDNDGVADVIAGVPHHITDPEDEDLHKINSGKALIFSGKTGSLLFTLEDPTADENGYFGTSVAALGDVNSDGRADFVVGAPGKADEDAGLANVGMAYILNGKNGRLIATLEDPGVVAGAHFGTAVANAGDVDGDGVSDVVVGAPGESRVHVFSGATRNLLYSIAGPARDLLPSFGAAVAGGQDFTRDGKPDIVVGAPLSSNRLGAVYIYNGLDGALVRRLKSPAAQTDSKFGAAIYLSSDISGDGRADIIVGAPGQDVDGIRGAGQAFVYDGTKGRIFSTLTSETPQAHGGYGLGLAAAVFPGKTVATPVVGAPYKDSFDTQTRLQIGQIEIPQ